MSPRMTRMPSVLTQYVIYDHPSDYPEHFVVRAWHIGSGGMLAGDAYELDSLDAAREFIDREAPGLIRLPRQPGDDHTIVEVWT